MSVLKLDEKASQTGFANLVGVSQQAISSQVKKENLSENGTYQEWLHQYCDQLRQQAAGRGGEDQVDVAKATYEEKTVKTAIMRLEYNEKISTTIHEEEAYQFLSDWAIYSAGQFRRAFERLRDDLKSQFDIDLPKELSEKHAGTAIDRVRGYALKLGASSGESGGVADASEEEKH
ncbi:hypothetical protein SAMN03080615_01654 [Amphritea atlantica]|uniref:Terminase small subunit n=1 Tax=Amphritea atlantica TaxID=355243 RepID=A0A1H9GFI2_9GAMM|nr:hypothetical protein [Amphritea atlantica]SEQ48875.1 hypothetical protein SAMN03080615_01654 [Amphritea atlantica]